MTFQSPFGEPALDKCELLLLLSEGYEKFITICLTSHNAILTFSGKSLVKLFPSSCIPAMLTPRFESWHRGRGKARIMYKHIHTWSVNDARWTAQCLGSTFFMPKHPSLGRQTDRRLLQNSFYIDLTTSASTYCISPLNEYPTLTHNFTYVTWCNSHHIHQYRYCYQGKLRRHFVLRVLIAIHQRTSMQLLLFQVKWLQRE